MRNIAKIASKALFVALLVFGNLKLTAATIFWSPTTTDNDLNTATNWAGGSVPQSSDIAVFGNALVSSLSYAAPSSPGVFFTPSQVTFNSGTFVQTLNLDGTQNWTMGGTGFLNSDGGSRTVNIVNGRTLTFTNSASAMMPASGGSMVYNVTGGGSQLIFNMNSTAGIVSGVGAQINVSGGTLTFTGSSTGGSADVTATNNASVISDHPLFLESLSTDSTSTVTFSGALQLGQSTTKTLAGLLQDGASAGTLENTGSGLLLITGNTNTYTGGTENQGTIGISGPNSLGTGPVFLIQVSGSAATLQFNNPMTFSNQINLFQGSGTLDTQANNVTLIQPLTGPGNLVKAGAGKLALAPGASFTGTTTITGGILSIPNDTALGPSNASVTFNGPGATLQMTGNTTSARNIVLTTDGTFDTTNTTDTFSGVISGPGGLIKTGTGTLILTGNNTYLSDTTILQGTLQGSTSSLHGNIIDNAHLVFSQSTPGTYSGTISGTGDVKITGGATITFTAPNTYSGGSIIDAGSTLIGNTSTIPGGNIVDNGTLTLNQSVSGTFVADISGTGSLNINQPANSTTTLEGTNSYTGGTNLSNGTLQGDTNSLQGNIAMAAATANVNFVQNFTGTFNGTISGPGSVSINQGGGNGTVIFGGATNNYTGGTTIYGGTLQGTTSNLQGNFLVNSSAKLDFNQNSNGTYAGVISGEGQVQINAAGGTGNITFTGINTYSGGTDIAGGILSVSNDNNLGATSGGLIFDGGTLQLTSNFTTSRKVTLNSPGGTIDTLANTATFNGDITGPGSLTKVGSGVLILKGQNNYTGGTFITAGTLQGDTTSLQGAITDNATLVFDQTTNGIFNGTLLGSGVINKIGQGILAITTNNSSFSGTTNVNQGSLALTGILGGDVNVNSGSTLLGTGTILGDLAINTGATISPGTGPGSIGTINVGGNFVQNPGSVYLDEFTRSGATDLINVLGTATLNGGTVKATSLDGGFSLKNYKILTAQDGVIGTYSNVIASNVTLQPVLVYDGNNVYLSFQKPFLKTANTANKFQVAQQLILAAEDNPSAAVLALLNQITRLTPEQITIALNELTGQQLASTILLSERSDTRFIRRLYDPLRPIITADPYCRAICYEDLDLDFWVSGGKDKAFYHSIGNADGFRVSGTDINFGVQTGIRQEWTVGIAGSYEMDQVHFDLNGSAKVHTAQGALYALYRPPCYYFLADLVIGNSTFRYKRDVTVGDLNFQPTASPDVIHGAVYLEIGKDFCLGCKRDWLRCLNIQPFIGLELGAYHTRKIVEHGGGVVDLLLDEHDTNTASTRLGAHFFLDCLCYFNLAFDIAWDYRLSSVSNETRDTFIAFGTPSFPIKGFEYERNSIDGALYLSTSFCGWDFFVEATGQAWQNASAYSYIAGFDTSW